MQFLDKFKEAIQDNVDFSQLYDLVPTQMWTRSPEKAAILALKRSQVFDSEKYAKTYGDLANLHIDMVSHYIMNGIHEKRKFIYKDPNENTDNEILILIRVPSGKESHLERSLENLLKQTYTKFSILCVFNKEPTLKNTYNTKKISFINKSSLETIKFHEKYILCVDIHDIYHKDLLSTIYPEDIDKSIDIHIFSTDTYSEESIEDTTFEDNFFQILQDRPCIFLYKRSVINNIPLKDLLETPAYLTLTKHSNLTVAYTNTNLFFRKNIVDQQEEKEDISEIVNKLISIYQEIYTNKKVRDSYITYTSKKIIEAIKNLTLEEKRAFFLHNNLNELNKINFFEYDSDSYYFQALKNFTIKRPCVSVLVPNYNNEKYLEKCIESILNQTLYNIEVIIVNDGSTDNSIEIIERYKKIDDRILVIDKVNTGYGNTMNVALEAASGEYIGIVESDDFVLENMYEELYKTAVENNCDLVKADFYRFKEDTYYTLDYNRLSPWEEYYNTVISIAETPKTFKFVMNTWSGIYKNDFLKEHNIRHNETPGASFQDNGFWFQTFMNSERAYFINTPFYMNRRDNENSSVFSKDKVYAFTNEYDFIKNKIDEDPKYKKFYGPYWFKRFKNYCFNYRRIAEEDKADFLLFFKNEFEQAILQKDLDTSLFGVGDFEDLNMLLKNQKGFKEKFKPLG